MAVPGQLPHHVGCVSDLRVGRQPWTWDAVGQPRLSFLRTELAPLFFAMQISDLGIAAWVGRVYFVWLSVFNLFVVSLMWSVFTDAYRGDQAKRLFGFISAGGTIGGIAGSAFASWLSQQADFIREANLNEADRFALISKINLWVLSLTLAVHLLGTAALLRRLGMAIVLGIFPLIYVIGFAGLAFWPSLNWMVALVVVHRAASYSVFAPAIQILYTVVDRRTLYQAKGFLDTAVVRGGDVLSAQLFGVLRLSGLSLTTIAAGFLPLAVLTGLLGMRVGRQQLEMQQRGRPAGHD